MKMIKRSLKKETISYIISVFLLSLVIILMQLIGYQLTILVIILMQFIGYQFIYIDRRLYDVREMS